MEGLPDEQGRSAGARRAGRGHDVYSANCPRGRRSGDTVARHPCGRRHLQSHLCRTGPVRARGRARPLRPLRRRFADAVRSGNLRLRDTAALSPVADVTDQIGQVLHVQLDALLPGLRRCGRLPSGLQGADGAPHRLLSICGSDRQLFRQSHLALDIFCLVSLQPLHRALLWSSRGRWKLALEVQPHWPFGPQAGGCGGDIRPCRAPMSLQGHFVHKWFLSLSAVSVPHSSGSTLTQIFSDFSVCAFRSPSWVKRRPVFRGVQHLRPTPNILQRKTAKREPVRGTSALSSNKS